MGKLAEAWVEIFVKDRLDPGFAAARASISGFVGSARASLSLPLTIATGAGGAAFTAFLADSTRKAVDFGETMNKVKVTFGDSAGVLVDQADELSKKFGVIRGEALDAASNIGLIAKGSGLSAEKAAVLSRQMVQLAADAASFYNVPIADALDKIRAGLVGEAEPLRAFGVNLSEAKVQAEAVSMGLAKSTKDLDDMAKTMARASLITKGLKDASGDLERTQDGAANQMKKVRGQFAEFQVEIGTKMIPVLQDLIEISQNVNAQFQETFDRSILDSFAEGLRSVAGAAGMLGSDVAENKPFGQTNTWESIKSRLAWNAEEFSRAAGADGLADWFGAVKDRANEALMDAAAKNMKGRLEVGPDPAIVARQKQIVPIMVNGVPMTVDFFRVGELQKKAAEERAARGDGIPGLLGGLLNAGQQALQGRLDQAGMLAGVGLDGLRERLMANPGKQREAAWSDMISASKQLQLDALRGEDPAKEMAAKLDKANGFLKDIKEGIAQAIARPAARAGVILRGPE